MSDDIRPNLPSEPRPSKFKPPSGACNTHAHVFGPYSKYPLRGSRKTAEGPLPMYQRMLDVLHFDRGGLTQPSHYGTENSCMLDALAATKSKGHIKGIVVMRPESLTDAEISRLDALGVRGVRFRDEPIDNGPSYDDLEAVGERIKGTGWHFEFTPTKGLEALVALRPRLEKLPAIAVFEQMGGSPNVELGVEHKTFQALLGMVRDGLVWVKLSHPYHLTDYPYAKALPFAQALVAANVKRCIFATDWTHPRAQEHGAVPDDGFLVDLFPEWVPNPAHQKTILVDNPAELYRF